MRAHSLLRRLASLSGVIALVAITGMAGAPVALAAGPVAVAPSPLSNPASVIANIVGDIAPEAAAARAAGFALANGSNGAINTGTIGEVVSVAKWVPGFKLGYKGGEWISQALGLYDVAPQQFVDGWIPYDGLVLPDTGWTTGNTIVGFPAANGQAPNGQPGYDVGNCAVLPGLTAGAPIAAGTPLIGCTGGALDLVNNVGIWGDGSVKALWGAQHAADNGGGGFSMYYPTLNDGNPVSPGGFIRATDGSYTTLIVRASNQEIVPDWIDFPNSPAAGSPAKTRYYFAGAGAHPPLADPNPTRLLRTTSTCQQAGGAAFLAGYLYSSAFRENDATLPSPPAAQCGTGQLVGSSLDMVDAATVAGGAGDTVVKHITDWTAPQSYQDWLTANPECWDGQCGVLLEQLGSDGQTWTSCFTNSAGCEHWFDQPDKAAKFRCTQAGKVLDLADCNAYSPTFDPAKLALGISYGDPATGASPQPSTTPMNSAVRQPLGVTVAQAVTAETGGGTTTNPTTQPSATSGAGFPTSGTNTAPAGVDAEGSSCMGDAWSWNPLNWVFIPVKCAVLWAFVPSAEEVGAAIGPMRDAFNASAVGAYVNGIGAKFQGMIPPGGDGDCMGPELAFDTQWTGPVSLHPLAACVPPVSTVAALTKLILTALVWFGVAVAAQAMILPAFGFKPFLARGDKTDVLA